MSEREQYLTDTIVRLANLLNFEVMPRYVEMFAYGNLGEPTDSVAVNLAHDELARLEAEGLWSSDASYPPRQL